MSDETDLTRLFAEAPTVPDDDAFVTRVTGHIAWRRRMILALPAAAAALLVLAIWATWPAASTFSAYALSGIALIADALGVFFTSPTGMLTATVLLLTAALWAWLFERMRGTSI